MYRRGQSLSFGHCTDSVQLTTATSLPFGHEFNELDDLLSFAEPGDAPVGVFDLFGDDVELQDAGIFGDIAPVNSSWRDTLSPLPDLSKVDSASNIKPVSSADSILSISGARTRLPRSAKELLDKWLDINKAEPYLKANDAEALAHLTGVTSQQIKTYVANGRARKLSAPPLPSHPSIASLNSYGSNLSLPARRGRRSYRANSGASLNSSQSQQFLSPQLSPRKFCCTWPPCTQSFNRKSDWKRHEETLHVPQEAWTCMPSFPTQLDHDTSAYICHFCKWRTEAFPAIDGPLGVDVELHLSAEHNYKPCFDRLESDRTFLRKDKLKQHVSQVHGQKKPLTDFQKQWCRPANAEAKFDCLFCEQKKMAWTQRVDHIAEHFEHGDVPRREFDAMADFELMLAPVGREM